MLQQEHRILLQLHECFDGLQRISKNEPRAIQSSKEIAHHRKPTTCHILKQNRRPAAFADPSMNLSRLQIGADFHFEPDQLAVLFQIANTLLKITIAHDDFSAVRLHEPSHKIATARSRISNCGLQPVS